MTLSLLSHVLLHCIDGLFGISLVNLSYNLQWFCILGLLLYNKVTFLTILWCNVKNQMSVIVILFISENKQTNGDFLIVYYYYSSNSW